MLDVNAVCMEYDLGWRDTIDVMVQPSESASDDRLATSGPWPMKVRISGFAPRGRRGTYNTKDEPRTAYLPVAPFVVDATNFDIVEILSVNRADE